MEDTSQQFMALRGSENEREKSKGKITLFAAIAGVVVVAAAFCTALFFLPGDFVSTLFPDGDGVNEAMSLGVFKSLIDNSIQNDGTVTLDETSIGSSQRINITELFLETVDSSQIVLTHAEISHTGDMIVIGGDTILMGSHFTVSGSLFYTDDRTPMLHLDLAPTQELHLSSIVADLPEDIRSLNVYDVELSLSSFDSDQMKDVKLDQPIVSAQGEDKAQKGLSLTAKTEGSKSNSTRIAQVTEFIKTKAVMLWGLIKPDFHLEIPIPNVALTASLSLINNTITLQKKDPVFKFLTHIEVMPDPSRPLVIEASGLFLLEEPGVALSGSLSSPWQPSAVESLTLLSASADITVSFRPSAPHRIPKGSISGSGSYGPVAVGFDIQYPQPQNVTIPSIELFLKDSHNPWTMPCFPSEFPSISSEQVILVITNTTEKKFCFHSNPAPVPCVSVTPGLNVFASVSFISNSRLLSLPESPSDYKLLLEAHYTPNKLVQITMDGPGHLDLSPAVALADISFAFKETLPSKVVTVRMGSTLVLETGGQTVRLASSATSENGVLTLTADETSPTMSITAFNGHVFSFDGAHVGIVYNRSVKTTDVNIKADGHIAGLAVSGTIDVHFGENSNVDRTCWPAKLQLKDSISMDSLSEKLTQRKASGDIEGKIQSEIAKALKTTIKDVVLDAKLKCHGVSLGFDMVSESFGNQHIMLNFTRHILASNAAKIIRDAAEREGDRILAEVRDDLEKIVLGFIESTVHIPDPFPHTAVGDYLSSLLKIALDKDSNIDASVVQSIKAVESRPEIWTHVVSPPTVDVITEQLESSVNTVAAPLESWKPTNPKPATVGGGNIAPFEPIKTYDLWIAFTFRDMLIKASAVVVVEDGSTKESFGVDIEKVVKKGVFFSFTIHPQEPSDWLTRTLHWLVPNANSIVLAGSVSGDAWSISESLEGDQLVTEHAVLTHEELKIQSSHPHVSISSTADVGIKDSHHTFSGVLVLDTYNDLVFTAGSVGNWVISGGRNGVTITDLSVELKVVPPPSASPSPSAKKPKMLAGGDEFALVKATKEEPPKVTTYSLEVLGGVLVGSTKIRASVKSSSSNPFVLKASVYDEKIAVGDCLATLYGDHGHQNDDSFVDVIQPVLNSVAFVGAELMIDVGSGKATFSGRMLALGGEADFEVAVEHLKQGDGSYNWEYMIGVGYATPTRFSNFVPSIKALDSLQLGPPALVLTSSPGSVTFHFPEVRPENPDVTYKVQTGLNFFASLDFGEDHVFGWVKRTTGIERLAVNMHVESYNNLEVKGMLEGHMRILPKTEITELGLVLIVKPLEVQVGVAGTAVIHPSKGGPLSLYGRVVAGELGISAKFSTVHDWVDVLGVQGLRMSSCDLEAEISYELIPLEFGVKGGLHYGAIGGDMLLLADLVQGDELVVKAQIDDFVLSDMYTACCTSFGPELQDWQLTLMTTGVERAMFYSNPSAKTWTFENVKYPPGTIVEASHIHVVGWLDASGRVSVDSNGFNLTASVEPFSVANIIDFGGYHDNPASLVVEMIKDKTKRFHLDVGLSVFSVSMGVFLDISDHGIEFDGDFKSDIFSFEVRGVATGEQWNKPNDFSVYAEMNQEVLDYLANVLPIYMERAKEEYRKAGDTAISRLEDARDTVNRLQNKIDEIRERDRRLEDEANQALTHAQMEVRYAKEVVDRLQNVIDDVIGQIRGLRWWNAWKAIPLGVELAGLEIAKGTADLALNAAIGVLEIARQAATHFHYLDPELDGLIAAKAIANVAIDAAEAALDGVSLVINNVMTAEQVIATGASKLFNPEYIRLSGSLAEIKKANLGQVTLRGMFVGQRVQFDVNVNLQLAEQLASAVWHWIARCFGDDGKLHFSRYLV